MEDPYTAVNDLEPSFNSQLGYPQERSKDFLSSALLCSDGAFNAEIIFLVLFKTLFSLCYIKGYNFWVPTSLAKMWRLTVPRYLGNFIELSVQKECLCQYGFYYTLGCATRHIKRKHGRTTDWDEEIRKQLELTHGITFECQGPLRSHKDHICLSTGGHTLFTLPSIAPPG